MESQSHMSKISHVPELLSLVIRVIHSNEPLARSLTIRLLGSLAVIIPNRMDVFHTYVSVSNRMNLKFRIL